MTQDPHIESQGMSGPTEHHFVTWRDLGASMESLKSGLMDAIEALGDRNEKQMTEFRRERTVQMQGGSRQFFATMSLTVAMIAATATYFHQSSADLRAHTDTEREHLEQDVSDIRMAMQRDDAREAEDSRVSGARGVELARIPILRADVGALEEAVRQLTALVGEARRNGSGREASQEARLEFLEAGLLRVTTP